MPTPGGYWQAVDVRLVKQSGQLNLQVVAAEDDGTLLYSSLYTVSTGENYYIELYLTAESSEGAGDGQLVWKINGVVIDTITSISNYELYSYISKIKLGNVERSSQDAVAKVDYDAGTGGGGGDPPPPPPPIEVTPPTVNLVLSFTSPDVIAASYITPDTADSALDNVAPDVVAASYIAPDPVDVSFEGSIENCYAPQEFSPEPVDLSLPVEQPSVIEAAYVSPDAAILEMEISADLIYAPQVFTLGVNDIAWSSALENCYAPQEFYPDALECVFEQNVLAPDQVQECVYVRPDSVDLALEKDDGFTYAPFEWRWGQADIVITGSVFCYAPQEFRNIPPVEVVLDMPLLLPNQVQQCVYVRPEYLELVLLGLDPDVYLGDTRLRILLRTNVYLAQEYKAYVNPPPIQTGMNDYILERTRINNRPIYTHTNDVIRERPKV